MPTRYRNEENEKAEGAQRILGDLQFPPPPEVYLNEKLNRFMVVGTTKFAKTPPWGKLKKKKKVKKQKIVKKQRRLEDRR